MVLSARSRALSLALVLIFSMNSKAFAAQTTAGADRPTSASLVSPMQAIETAMTAIGALAFLSNAGFQAAESAGMMPAPRFAALPAPQVTGIMIAHGAPEIFYRQVTVDLACAGSPTEMIVGETRDFAGAAWQPYRSRFAFTFSPGAGKKYLFIKVRDSLKVLSPMGVSSAWLRDLRPLGTDGQTVNATLAGPGDAGWFFFDVKAGGRYDVFVRGVGLKDHYLRVFGPDRRDLMIAASDNWYHTFDPRLILPLAPGRYYAKVQEIGGRPSSYAISVERRDGPVIGYFEMYGTNTPVDSQTLERKVTLFTAVVAAPGALYYRASERSDFAGAAWAAYTPRAAYTLSQGDGPKKVFFQARDSAGRLSEAWFAEVVLAEKRPLALGQALRSEFVQNPPVFGQYFEFKVAEYGTYVVELVPDPPTSTAPGLRAYSLGLFHGDLRHTFENGATGRIGMFCYLPGTHMLQVYPVSDSPNLPSYGKFSIRVWKYDGGPLLTWLWDKGQFTRERNWAFYPEYVGSATHCKTSTRPDFAGATWQPFFNEAVVALPAGSGAKTVYCKLRDGDGRESPVMSQTVYLTETRAITPGAAAAQFWYPGSYPLYFSFTVTTPGTYTVETLAGASPSVSKVERLELQEAGYDYIFRDPVAIVPGTFPVKRYDLDTGTYEIFIHQMDTRTPPAPGNFKLRVYR